MSLSSIAGLLMLLASTGHAKPGNTAPQCPAVLHGARLENVSVFDGPLSEQADLVPTNARESAGRAVTTWDIGYVYEQGRQVHLKCTYRGRPPLDVAIPKPVSRCLLIETKTQQSASCR